MGKFFKVVGITAGILGLLYVAWVGLMIYVISSLSEAIHEEVQAQRIERWVREIEADKKADAHKHPRAKKHAKPLRHDRRRVVCGSRVK